VIIIVDTGILLAAADADHQRCARLLRMRDKNIGKVNQRR
jgi:predicted nucleic acid-binding protein